MLVALSADRYFEIYTLFCCTTCIMLTTLLLTSLPDKQHAFALKLNLDLTKQVSPSVYKAWRPTWAFSSALLASGQLPQPKSKHDPSNISAFGGYFQSLPSYYITEPWWWNNTYRFQHSKSSQETLLQHSTVLKIWPQFFWASGALQSARCQVYLEKRIITAYSWNSI